MTKSKMLRQQPPLTPFFCFVKPGGTKSNTGFVLNHSNDVDPQAWLADVLDRINDQSIQRLDQLLPWNWKATPAKLAA